MMEEEIVNNDSNDFPTSYFSLPKEKFCENSINFLLNRDHMWCRYSSVMVELLFLFEKENDSVINYLLNKMAKELQTCCSCANEYQKAKQIAEKKYEIQYTKESIEKIFDILYLQDVRRIKKNLTELQDQYLVPTISEILIFFKLLENDSLDALFSKRIIGIQENGEFQIEPEKWNGLYLLYIHHEAGVRFWAHTMIKRLPKISGIEELSNLLPILEKYMYVLEFDAFGEIKYFTSSKKEFWSGLAALLLCIEHDTFQNYFIKHFPDFIKIIQNHLNEETTIFWPVLKIFDQLLDVFGYKLWSNSSFSPSVVCNNLLKQCLYGPPQEYTHKLIFKLFTKILSSLENFDEYVALRDTILEFLIVRVPINQNFKGPARHEASLYSIEIIQRGFQIKNSPLRTINVWGPRVIGFIIKGQGKDEKVNSQKEKESRAAVKLINDVMQNDVLTLKLTKKLYSNWPAPIWDAVLENSDFPLELKLGLLNAHQTIALLDSNFYQGLKAYSSKLVTFLNQLDKSLENNLEFIGYLFSLMVSPNQAIYRATSLLVKKIYAKPDINAFSVSLVSTSSDASSSFLTGVLKCIQEFSSSGVNFCYSSWQRLFSSLTHIIPKAYVTYFGIKENAKSKIIKKILKYLWVVFEQVFTEGKILPPDKPFFVESLSCFLDLFQALFPLLAVRNYPARLIQKWKDKENLEQSFLNDSFDDSQRFSLSQQTTITNNIESSILSLHGIWLKAFDWRLIISVRDRWLSCLVVVLKELSANRVNIDDSINIMIQEILEEPVFMAQDRREALKSSLMHVNEVFENSQNLPENNVSPLLNINLQTDFMEEDETNKPNEEPTSPSFFDLEQDEYREDENPSKPEVFENNVTPPSISEEDKSKEGKEEDVLEQLMEDKELLDYQLKMKFAAKKPKVIQLDSKSHSTSKPKTATVPPKKKQTIDDVLRIILNWRYDALETTGSVEELLPVPIIFKSVEEYIRVFQPLLIEEFRCQLVKDKQENKTPINDSGYLYHVQNIDDFHLVEFKLTNNAEETGFKNDDVVLLTKSEVQIIGKIDYSNKSKDRNSNPRIVPVKLFLKFNKNAANALNDKSRTWTVTKIGSITTMIREYKALYSVDKIPLMPTILSPRIASTNIRIPEIYFKCLQNRLNETQINAIKYCTSVNGFALLQGPPGTGKTSAIVGLLSVLLNYYPVQTEKKASPLYFNASENNNNSNKNSPNNPANKFNSSKNHILVCAPSNAAIDEIVLRVFKKGIWDVNGKSYIPKILRLGAVNTIHPDVRVCALDNLLKKSLDDPDTNYQKEKKHLKENLSKMRDIKANLTKLHDEIAYNTQKIKNNVLNNDEALQTNALLNELYEKKKNLVQKLEKCEAIEKGGSAQLDNARETQLSTILNEAAIICCTLSNSGSEKIGKFIFGFETVIIDEAAQAVELSTLIPLRHGCKRAILVGDPRQLPATVISKLATSYQYEQSMFQRFQSCQYPSTMLHVQYRMHPEIRLFPSLHFYDNLLQDGPNVKESSYTLPIHSDERFGVYKFYDLLGEESTPTGSNSLRNSKEAQFVANLVLTIAKEYNQESLFKKIGIITPYKQQLAELKKVFIEALKEKDFQELEINTADGFQGREKDIIIVSCVRAHSDSKSIGFLSDIRRLNVVLTRARKCLYVVGYANSLEINPHWKDLIDNAKSRNCYLKITDPNTSFPKKNSSSPKHSLLSSEDPRNKKKAKT